MADPISIIGLVVTIGQVAQGILTFTSNVRSATGEVRGLLTELLALKAFLEQIQAEQESAPDAVATQKYSSGEFREALYSAQETVASVQKDLDLVSPTRQSKFHDVARLLKWPLKTQDVHKHMSRLERLKSYFLLTMMANTMESGGDIRAELKSLHSLIQEDVEERRAENANSFRSKAAKWLSPVDPSAIHEAVRSSSHAGTGQWFLKGPLQKLTERHPKVASLMWLKGKSGMGKSVLMSNAITYLQSEASTDDSCVVYFYCKFDDIASQNPKNIFGSLLAQFSPRVGEILDDYVDMLKKDTTGSPITPEVPTLLESVKEYCRDLSLYVVLDALNESPHSLEIVQALADLLGSLPNVRVLVSSTDDAPELPTSRPILLYEIEMLPDNVNEDIRQFVEYELQTNKKLKRLSVELKDEIRKALLEQHEANFRYVRWQLQHLVDQPTGKEMRARLKVLPQSLNETYAQRLNSQGTQSAYRPMFQKALLWLSFAARPLTLNELAEAVILEEDYESLEQDDRLAEPECLVELGRGLLDYDRHTGVVSIAHSSVKSFLTSDWISSSSVADFKLDEDSAHRTIMRLCLTYLMFNDFSGGVGTFAASTDTTTTLYEEAPHLSDGPRPERYPLLDYAVEYWAFHLSDDCTRDDWEFANKFLSTRTTLPNGGNYGCWIDGFIGVSAFGYSRAMGPRLKASTVVQSHPLYYAASLGLPSLVRAVLRFDPTADLEAGGGRRGSTPLHVACFRRYRDIARVLVAAGADMLADDPGFGDGTGMNGLFWARMYGWTDVIELAAGVANAKAEIATAAATSATPIGGKEALAEQTQEWRRKAALAITAQIVDAKAGAGGGVPRRGALKHLPVYSVPAAAPYEGPLRAALAARFGADKDFVIRHFNGRFWFSTYSSIDEPAMAEFTARYKADDRDGFRYVVSWDNTVTNPG